MSGRFLLAGILAGFCACGALAGTGASQGAAVSNHAAARSEGSSATGAAPSAAVESVASTSAQDIAPTVHCSAYFSAYGVSPEQLRWITNHAHKQYPGICAAPKPSLVDYVVIFTHDVHFYPSAMPQAVRVDAKGFSDWTPLTTVDTALVPHSQIDHAHHEYVWVFRVRRGSFNPGAFSAKSRAQFAKKESRNSARTAEDAFGFIAGRGTGPAGTALGQ